MYPADLSTLPLHTITEEYGEDGLRERLRREVAGLPAATRGRLQAALDLASELHRDDRRIREPYVNHLLRVTIRVLSYYHVTDVDVLTAALLHDAVEDHPAELAGLPPQTPYAEAVPAALAALGERFGSRVAELVGAVTNPDYRDDRDEHEQYREHLAESLAAHPWARVIKFSDFTDNAVGVVWTTPDKGRRGAVKYRPLIPILRALVNRADTPLEDGVKQHIHQQLDTAQRRLEEVLGPAS
jgi:(p)ppGpp synthase/HD superfamily hydrolase